MLLSIAVALQKATSFLRARGVPSARFEAELLLAFVLKKERVYIYSHGEEPLSRRDLDAYRLLAERRAAGVPPAYLTGEKEFMGLTFVIEEGVLIPRPETEHLVEAVISWAAGPAAREASHGEGLRILDLGTGSGAIGLSLLAFLPASRVTGIDIDEKALSLTRKNARRLGVEGRLETCRGNYWEALGDAHPRFDVIVSNPPYIPTPLLTTLQEEVRREPRTALDGGQDGLDAYRAILGGIRTYLGLPGLLALEIGAGQAEGVSALAGQNAAFLGEPRIEKDYAGIPRLLLFERRA